MIYSHECCIKNDYQLEEYLKIWIDMSLIPFLWDSNPMRSLPEDYLMILEDSFLGGLYAF